MHLPTEWCSAVAYGGPLICGARFDMISAIFGRQRWYPIALMALVILSKMREGAEADARGGKCEPGGMGRHIGSGYTEAKNNEPSSPGWAAKEPSNEAQRNAARSARVYCRGPLLQAVQKANLFSDSKTFVDMPMLEEPELVLAAFETLPAATTRDGLMQFVKTYFGPPGGDLEPWTPTDWVRKPRKLALLDEPWQSWALDLNERWKMLGRVASERVRKHPARSSLLAPPNPFVVPGGRFREPYYWDTYWIVEGLLACEMFDTARYVVDNLLAYIGDFGFVPNGGRVYYLNRSQPPLLSEMVVTYLNAAIDAEREQCAADLVRKALPLLVVEYRWWMLPENGHVVRYSDPTTGRDFVLNRYNTDTRAPRPEAYTEDVSTAAEVSPSRRASLYSDLAAAAESGWDFSSRWIECICNNNNTASGSANGSLALTATRDVVPVDLNAIMLRYERNLAAIHHFVDLLDASATMSPMVREIWFAARRAAGLDPADASNDSQRRCGSRTDSDFSNSFEYYVAAAAERTCAIEALLWRPELGIWRDLHLSSRSARTDCRGALASDFTMIWAGASDNTDDDAQRALVSRLAGSELLQPGGILTSLLETGQQWDAPNAWPPLQFFIIKGLRRLRVPEAAGLASTLSKAWLESNYAAWHSTGNMFEKYNAFRPGIVGGGGEYTPQLGFGWTNGVVLSLLTEHVSPPQRDYQ